MLAALLITVLTLPNGNVIRNEQKVSTLAYCYYAKEIVRERIEEAAKLEHGEVVVSVSCKSSDYASK